MKLELSEEEVHLLLDAIDSWSAELAYEYDDTEDRKKMDVIAQRLRAAVGVEDDDGPDLSEEDIDDE